MAQYNLEDLTHRDLGGEKSNLGGIVDSGSMRFGSNNRAQVGFGQSRSEAWVNASNSIPHLVIPPVWTALTNEVSDAGGLSIIGAKLPGQAATEGAGTWFGNIVEAMIVKREGKSYRRLQLAEFIDEKGARHLCKIRSAPGALPPFLEDEDITEADAKARQLPRFQNFNLGYFHELVDKARRDTEAEFAAEFADAPGLPEGLVETGEPLPVAPTAAKPAVAGPAPSVPATPPHSPPMAPPTPVSRPGGPTPRPTTPQTAVGKPPQRVVVAPPPGRGPVPGTATATKAAEATRTPPTK